MKSLTIALPQALAAWGSPAFPTILKAELERLQPEALPLQQGLSHGSYVSGEEFQVMILTLSDEGRTLRVRAGIHYQSIIAGCSCADDPTPVDELSEYCQVEIALDKESAVARVALLDE